MLQCMSPGMLLPLQTSRGNGFQASLLPVHGTFSMATIWCPLISLSVFLNVHLDMTHLFPSAGGLLSHPSPRSAPCLPLDFNFQSSCFCRCGSESIFSYPFPFPYLCLWVWS